jgi:hypothetical protein
MHSGGIENAPASLDAIGTFAYTGADIFHPAWAMRNPIADPVS